MSFLDAHPERYAKPQQEALTNSFRPFDTALIDDLRDILVSLKTTNLKSYTETLVIVPTRRAVKDLKFALSDKATTTTFLPTILAVTDVPDHVLGPDKTTLTANLRRGLAFQTLKTLGVSASFDMATQILALVDDVTTFDINLDDLDTLVPETYAEHWQTTSSFLKTFVTAWRAALSARGWQDEVVQIKVRFEELCTVWTQHAPSHNVILAGLDGFIPYIRSLIHCVDQLPNRQILWTGVLPQLESSTLEKTTKATHPNYLATTMAYALPTQQPEVVSSRTALLQHMFSDVPYDDRDLKNLRFEGVSIYAAKTLAQEAAMVALLVREHLESSQDTIAIVTPDPQISKRIQQDLALWNIRVDSASGQSQMDTPEARLLMRLLKADLFLKKTLSVFSVLKDPLVTWDHAKPLVDLEAPIRSGRIDPTAPNFTEIVSKWDTLIAPLITLRHQDASSPLDLWHCVESLCETLSPRLTESDLFASIKQSCQDLYSVVPSLSFLEFLSFVTICLRHSEQREAVNHPRVRLMSPIQSAFSRFKTVICCALNEGVWPGKTPDNPWLNLDMQLKLGLPDQQALIGRGAWLLAQNMRAQNVVLTYADRRGSDPIRPSRWLQRLKTLATAYGQNYNQSHCQDPDELLSLPSYYDDILAALEQPKNHKPYKEPLPVPLQSCLPTKYSISDIQRLLRDPYQAYAKQILGLYPLPDLSQDHTMADYGTFIHRCLEHSVQTQSSFQKNFDMAITKLKSGQSCFGMMIPDLSLIVLWQQITGQFLEWIDGYLLDQASNAKTTFVEQDLSTSIPLNGQPITIIGKADRIDLLHDGTYEVIDYKTGSPPSKKEVMTGQAPQLALLGKLFMLSNPGTTVSKLTYVALGSQNISSYDAQNIVEDTWTQVTEILTKFHTPGTPFHIDIQTSLSDRFNEYALLERTSEWLMTQRSTQGTSDHTREVA